jgi:putative flavoprotein involved in K+ transport
MDGQSSDFDVIVIGGGQYGLAMGYHLKKSQRRFVILDGAEGVGQSWRDRYDSLRIFTPNIMNTLPGADFKSSKEIFPSKDEVADYLCKYAKYFELPIRLRSRVTLLRPTLDFYEVQTAAATYRAAQVVVATGAFHVPSVPSFSQNLASNIYQVHSSGYRRPSQLPEGTDILVVGAGNSGAQIALELAQRHKIYLSAGHPFYSSPRWLLESVWAWRIHRWRWRHLHRYVKGRLHLPWPIGNTQHLYVPDFGRQLRKLSIELVPRVASADGGEVELSDGRRLQIGAVIWATGYRPDYSWIDAPILDERGGPILEQQARAMRGLYFLGLRLQRTPSSSFILGVADDTAHVAELMEKEIADSAYGMNAA